MKLWIAGAAVVIAGLIAIVIAARPRATEVEASATKSGDSAGDEAAATPTQPLPVRARADDPKAAERRYLEERRRAAEIEASKIIAEHEPSAYAPENDHTVIVPPLRKARDAFHAHRYEEAIAQLEAALEIDPDKKSARSMLVEAACTIGEESLARLHVTKLDPLRQKIAAKRCDARGVILPGIEWRGADLP